jgi:hypothetical protein
MPERSRQLSEILVHLRSLEPGKRAAYLDRACAGDGELRKEVESLFELAPELGDFLEDSALDWLLDH